MPKFDLGSFENRAPELQHIIIMACTVLQKYELTWQQQKIPIMFDYSNK